MADQSEQHLQDISSNIQQMVELLRVNNQQTNQQSIGSQLPSMVGAAAGGAALMSDPSGPPDFVSMMMREQDNRSKQGEKPREILKKSTPVDITKFSPKSLQNLANAIKGEPQKPGEISKQGESFIDGLLRSIGTPLLALAGGVTALLASANIDFGSFEGLANAVGKGGLQAGLKMFTKAFGKLAGPMLRKIPVVGALVSFYYASERFKKGDAIGMAIDVASGIANLLNLVMPGIGSMLSIGLDMLNAYLDYKTSDADDPQAAKTDILKGMASKTWAAIQPYIRYIPVIGSIWLGKDAYDAFEQGDVANGLIYALRAVLNLAPGVGTIANIGLGLVQGMLDPSKKEDNLIMDGAFSLVDKFGPMFKEYIEPFVRDIPFVGGFFHAADMIEDFKSGKWGTGFMSLVQTVASFVPGFGLLLTPALSFFRGIFDPSYKGKSKLGDLGGDAMDWMKGLVQTAKDWFNDFIYSLVDKIVPNIFGLRGKIKNKLRDWGLAPAGAKIQEQETFNPDAVSNLTDETIDAMLTKEDLNYDLSDTERENLVKEQKKRKVRKSFSGGSYGNYYTRATGGPVDKGESYIVGEQGPEMFQPVENGNIINNQTLSKNEDEKNQTTNMILQTLEKNNEILNKLSYDIITAIHETGTVVNTNNIANSTLNNTTGGQSVDSFRDSFRNSFNK